MPSSNFFKSKKFFSLALTIALVVPSSQSLATEPATSVVPIIHTATSAKSILYKLVVKGRAPKTGYARELFSDGWGDIGGCDARNAIIMRDFESYTLRRGEDCIVEYGVLNDPYTGKTINFKRGMGTSLAVQIDHVVAVSDAWQKGAQKWSPAKRYNFYNDPLNLLAVDGPTNSQKSDSDAASWLPPRKAFRCAYVARQIAVKYKYGVWVTSAEKAQMGRTLSACQGYPLPRR